MKEDGCVAPAEPPSTPMDIMGKSEGKESSAAVGCNANNDIPSVRTLNANNGLDNDNGNYAGAFAVISSNTETIGKSLTSRAPSTKTTDSHVATGGHGRCDYGSLPFWGGEDKAESNAESYRKEAIHEELMAANSKRKLKNLKKFFTDPILIREAIDRTLAGTSSKDKDKSYYETHKEEIAMRIERELSTETYRAEPNRKKKIKRAGKGDKERIATVSTLYDRIIQTLMLKVIEGKMRKRFVRNIYSGIMGRSVLSNDRRYCMINKIRHAVKNNQELWAGMTDIRKFYDTLDMNVVLGTAFKPIVCPYTRRLLVEIFRYAPHLPIGCCLSQMLGMNVVLDCDREILRRFDVRLYCFGDNRLAIGRKDEVRSVLAWQKSHYEGAYGLSVKSDWQICRVKNGFRFCKYDYIGSFVKPRAELRRRAVRAYKRGWQHYAGYKGILDKTDSKHLKKTIRMEIVNRHGMTVRTQRGEKKKLRDLKEDTVVVPVEYRIEKSTAKEDKKSDALMVRMTYIAIFDNKKRLYHSTEGSEEIVEFFRLVERGEADLTQRLHIIKDGTKVAFAEYHTTAEEACNIICEELGIV